MYKKARSTCKIVVSLIKPIAVLTFSLPSPSPSLKLPKEASAEKRETGANSKDQVQVTMSTLSTTTVLIQDSVHPDDQTQPTFETTPSSDLPQWKIFWPINLSSVHYTDNFCAARKIIPDRGFGPTPPPKPGKSALGTRLFCSHTRTTVAARFCDWTKLCNACATPISKVERYI